jgi:uncharacterized protein (TIGR03086 family)
VNGLRLLDLAGAWFIETLAQVRDGDWGRDTPCDDWDLGQLVDHVIGGNWFTTAILGGAPAAAALAAAKAGFAAMDDRHVAVTESIAAQTDAFGRPDTLELIFDHVAGEMPGSTVLRFRIIDLTIHGWDLARGIDADPNIPQPLVEAVWADVSGGADWMTGSGSLGDGPGGAVPPGADLQTRLLDATGRGA